MGLNAFTPINIGAVTLKNRIVFPSICTFYCNEDGTVSPDFREFFRSLVDGGIGLVIIPANPHPGDSAGRPSLCHDRFIPQWQELRQIAHDQGARLFAQLHPVAVFDQLGQRIKEPVDFPVELIQSLVESFGLAAKRAQNAGVDGVEIEGCHEQYIADFLSAYSNKRMDAYGGDIAGRAKIALDIVRSIRRHCGEAFPIMFKISSSEVVEGGRELPETIEIIQLLCREGIDAVDVSIGMAESEEYKCAPMDLPDCFNADASKAVRDVVDIPVMLVDRIVTIEQANQLIEDGKTDMAGMARAHVADPALVNKFLGINVAPPIRCVGCNQGCRTGSSGNRKFVNCMQNPFAGKLDTLRLPEPSPLLKHKKIVVVGAGPSGLETACLLAEKGLRPVVYEKNPQPGGLIRLAAIPPYKANMQRVIHCRVERLKQLGIDLRCGTEYTLEMAMQEQPDYIFLATGSTPAIPPIAGIDGANIYSGDSVLQMNRLEGRRIAVLGGGLIGCETAEYLAHNFDKQVDLFEMREDIAVDLVKSRRKFMLRRMNQLDIQVHTNTKVLELALPQITMENNDGIQTLSGFDGAVIALGRRSASLLREALEKEFGEHLYLLGDAKQPSLAIYAIQDAAATVHSFLHKHSKIQL